VALYSASILFLILFSLLVVLCINEYHGIIHNLLTSTPKWKTTYKLINTIFSVIIFGIVFLVASNKIPLISWSLLCGFPLTWLVIEMYTKSEKPFYNVCLELNGYFLFGHSVVIFLFTGISCRRI
jgi:hypothetical protein